jgi:hypothetical protein
LKKGPHTRAFACVRGDLPGTGGVAGTSCGYQTGRPIARSCLIASRPARPTKWKVAVAGPAFDSRMLAHRTCSQSADLSGRSCQAEGGPREPAGSARPRRSFAANAGARRWWLLSDRSRSQPRPSTPGRDGCLQTEVVAEAVLRGIGCSWVFESFAADPMALPVGPDAGPPAFALGLARSTGLPLRCRGCHCSRTIRPIGALFRDQAADR